MRGCKQRLRLSPAQSKSALHDCYHSLWHGSEICMPRSYNKTCVLYLHPYLCSNSPFPQSRRVNYCDFIVSQSGKLRIQLLKKMFTPTGQTWQSRNFKSLKCIWLLVYWLKMILQNENLQGAEGMKRISVRIIQSLSDYPGNMEQCQVEEVVIGGCAVSVSVWTCICASSVCFFFEKQWHFCTLIEIISMRIEPSQSNSTLYDYFCACLNSSCLLAFTFRALRTTQSVSLAAM